MEIEGCCRWYLSFSCTLYVITIIIVIIIPIVLCSHTLRVDILPLCRCFTPHTLIPYFPKAMMARVTKTKMQPITVPYFLCYTHFKRDLCHRQSNHNQSIVSASHKPVARNEPLLTSKSQMKNCPSHMALLIPPICDA